MQPGGQPTSPNGAPLLAGRYTLLEKIGEGGAAEVYRAHDTRLNRVVAIKILRPQLMAEPSSQARFMNEARTAAGLSQPNIVDVYDFGETPGGSMFIVMQYVEGRNLKDVLRQRGRMLPADVISITIQVCRALAAAHAKGLIHRDVKPQNIMLDRQGNVRLTDFGVVKALSGGSDLTQAGMTFGTAAYLSPEQATGATIGPQSDIYGLGCVMYEMLCGDPPFTGDSPASVAYMQVWERPRPLHDLVPEVPPSLEKIVMRCLEKDPQARYPTAMDLASALDSLQQAFGRPTQAVSLASVSAPVLASTLPRAEQSAAVPMPAPAPAGATAANRPTVAVPPVRVQTTTHNGIPAAAAGASTRVVNVNTRQGGAGSRWFAAALIVLLLAGALGFFAFGQFNLFGGAGGGATSTPTVAGAKPTATLGQIIVATDTVVPTETATPGDTPGPSETATDTPEPSPTETVTAEPTLVVVPTVTSQPRPKPTNTPEPPPPPTDTPVPPPPPVVTLDQIVDQVLATNPQLVSDYVNGDKEAKRNSLSKLVGIVVEEARPLIGDVKPNVARDVVTRRLEALQNR